jgi:hypothetical protein
MNTAQLAFFFVEVSVEESEPFPEYRCCERARLVECVCRASYKCPMHGQHCHGSHD